MIELNVYPPIIVYWVNIWVVSTMSQASQIFQHIYSTSYPYAHEQLMGKTEI